MNLSTEEYYSFESPRRQYFSLPYFVISYIIETPSPQGLQKLQQTCKYFFSKKKVVVVEKPVTYLRLEDGNYCFECPGKKLPLGKSHYWFTDLIGRRGNCFSTLRSYIYRLTLTELHILSENLALNDINFLLSNDGMKTLYFFAVNLQEDDGTPLSVDFILGKVPNVTRFIYNNKCEIYSNNSLEKLNSVKLFSKLKYFYLTMEHTSDEEIDPQILWEFIKKNAEPSSVFQYFCNKNEREVKEIKKSLQMFLDTWTPAPNEKPPSVFISQL